MLASRFLLRANLALLVGKTCVRSRHLPFLLGCSYHSGFKYNSEMDLKENLLASKVQEKQKVVTQVWRPVSTLSTSCEGEGSDFFICWPLRADFICIYGGHHTFFSHLSGDTPPVDEKQMSVAEKHSISIQTGAALMRFIKGKGGVTQKKIEEDLGVQISFSSSQKEDSLTIEGNSPESVAEASERIKIIIDEALNSTALDYSHFVSLPLSIHADLVNKLINFQSSILGATEVNEEGNSESNSNGDTSSEEEGMNISKTPKVVAEPKTENDGEHAKVDVPKISLVSYAPKVSSKLSGIQKSTFVNPRMLHLTVLMLKLWNKARVEKAVEVLKNVSSKVIDALENRPISVRLKGLKCMKGSFARARVLYAPVEEIGDEGRLSRACPFSEVIIDAFLEAGLVLEKDAQQKLKLHVTVMNARHTTRGKKWRKGILPFDGTAIYERYGSEEWGDYLIGEAHLSQRFVYDENGYYHCCASIPFPEGS
ncbi:unnamed protein product [Cuscuta campestris]|uniref:K Homology domain-containing protein n=2 Tax=Cuscuta campestris TaxID=132261 RepID=A0A484LKL7_9ASTE|nr:unnamed protein product [Cuscuta campestris]